MAPRFEIGDFVWAKMRGYPYWPAQIVFPPEEDKVERKQNQHFIYFYGSKNYAWLPERNLNHHTNEILDEARSKKKKPKLLVTAIEEFIEELEEQPEETEEQTEDEIEKETEGENPVEEDMAVEQQEMPKAGCSGYGLNSHNSLKLSYGSTKKDKKKDQRKLHENDRSNDAQVATVSEEEIGGFRLFTFRGKRPTTSINMLGKNDAPQIRPLRFLDENDSNDAQCSTISEEERYASCLSKLLKKEPTEYTNMLKKNDPIQIPPLRFFEKVLPKPPNAVEPLPPVIETPKTIEKASSDPVKNVEVTNKKVGIVGLNIISLGIIKNLLDSAHRIVVYDMTPEKCHSSVAAGAIRADTPAALVTSSDVTVMCISEKEFREEVIFGKDGIIQGFSESGQGKGYIEMSVTDKTASKPVANALAPLGVRYLRVHFLGSKRNAESGHLVPVVTGDPTLYEECKSYFKAIGENCSFMEDEDQAEVVDAALNLYLGINYAAAGEIEALSERLGLRIKDMPSHLEMTKRFPGIYPNVFQTIADKEENTADIPLKFIYEKMESALTMAGEINLPLHLSRAAIAQYAEAMEKQYGDHDVSAVHTTFK